MYVLIEVMTEFDQCWVKEDVWEHSGLLRADWLVLRIVQQESMQDGDWVVVEVKKWWQWAFVVDEHSV